VGQAHLDGEKQAPCTATAALRSAVRRGGERGRGEAVVGENCAGIASGSFFWGRRGRSFSEKSHGWFGEDAQRASWRVGPVDSSGGGRSLRGRVRATRWLGHGAELARGPRRAAAAGAERAPARAGERESGGWATRGGARARWRVGRGRSWATVKGGEAGGAEVGRGGMGGPEWAGGGKGAWASREGGVQLGFLPILFYFSSI
jgi:hypothetical protein